MVVASLRCVVWFSIVGIAWLGTTAAAAQDKPAELKLTVAQSPAFPLGKAAERWGALLTEASSSRFQVKLHPGAVLAGRDPLREFGTLRDGGADLAVGSALMWSTELPAFAVYALPWLAPEPREQVALGVVIPDPFDGYGGGVIEGGCYTVEVKWERPNMDEPSQCSASTVLIRRLVEGEPVAVPSMLYRLSGGLDVVDEVGDFSLTAALAGDGTITCPCEGGSECCREQPGTRDVQFTVALAGEEFMGEPLQAEQSQELKLDDAEPGITAGISLVRSHFPSECAAPAVHEWVFRHPSAF